MYGQMKVLLQTTMIVIRSFCQNELSKEGKKEERRSFCQNNLSKEGKKEERRSFCQNELSKEGVFV